MPTLKPSRPGDKTLVGFSHLLADRAAKAVLPHFRRAIPIDDKGAAGRKGAYDPVTEADRSAERAITKLIAAAYPDHGIVGEEFGNRNEAARLKWVIDPVDGTRAFIMGQTAWGTLIGLLDDGTPLVGLMSQPFTQERFWGSASGSFYRHGTASARRLKTRTGGSLRDAILTSTAPDMFAGQEDAFARVSRTVRMTRFGGDCYNYCLLASGFIDVIIEAGLKSYDIVALIPIIERAGGVVSTWDGSAPTSGGSIVASGDPRIHDQVLKLLAKR